MAAIAAQLTPALVDFHVRPVFGDWTPRQNQLGWIESCINGRVTTMISAGEVYLLGRPKDVVGVKALAITVQSLLEPGRPAEFVFLDRAQHTAGTDSLDSVRLGDIPGVGLVMIDGTVRCGCSRNTPPTIKAPVLLPGH